VRRKVYYEWLVGKDLEGDRYDLFKDIIPAFCHNRILEAVKTSLGKLVIQLRFESGIS
jgi:hypothetical protein